MVASAKKDKFYMGFDQARDPQDFGAISFTIQEADLIGNVTQFFVTPCSGCLQSVYFVVQKSLTTGGTVKVQINGVDARGITGTFSRTFANGGVPGTMAKILSGPGNYVAPGDVISLVLSGFATAGRVNGVLVLR